MAQPNNPTVKDWVSKVREELEYLFSKEIIYYQFVLADYLCLREAIERKKQISYGILP